MAKIKPGYNALPDKDPGKKSFSCSIENLIFLEDVLEEEREAIEKSDQEFLQQIGDQIDRLLEELAVIMPHGDDLPREQAELLLRAIGKVKSKRESNCRLIEATVQDTGRAIGQASAGRQVLKAYRGSGSRKELFLKKKC